MAVETLFEKEINILIGSFVGHKIYVFGDYKVHSYLYAMQSTPWYISILVQGIFAIIILITAIIIKLIILEEIKAIINFQFEELSGECKFSNHM